MRALGLILAILALQAASRPAPGADDFSHGMLERAAALSVAREVSSEGYPDAEEVLIAAKLHVRYNRDATYTQWHEEYVKVLTEKGRRNHRTLSSYFTIPYQRGPQDCAIKLVEIIKPDGSSANIDVATQGRIMVDPGSMSQNIYNPNSKIIEVNVPGLEIGDVLHFVMFDRIVQPRMRGTWSDWIILEDTRPILRKIVEVHAPRETPLASRALKDEIEGTVTFRESAKDDTIRYLWEARDVPRMFPEPNMPPVHTVVQRLLISTAPDWQTVSRWYRSISEPHYEPSDEMKAKAREIVTGAAGTRDKIEKLFQFVSHKIRYMGITVETTSPGYEPHDVKDTFAAKHGVCRDKAALLVVMLRLAGLDAFPALIHAGPKKDREVPQPYFNHVIAAVRNTDGTYVLMDPTDENTTELLPAYLNGKSYLVATPEGDTLRTSPIAPAADNMMLIDTIGAVDESGGLSAETVLRFRGINDGAYRGWFARSKPEDRRRYFEGLVKRAAPGARITEISYVPGDMMNTATTLTVTVAYKADDLFIRGEESLMLPLPSLGTRVGMVNFIMGKTGLKKRKYPLMTEMACGVREQIRLQLPTSVAAPKALPLFGPANLDYLAWHMNTQSTGSVLTAAADFRLEVVEFDPDQYLGLKQTLKDIERALRAMPVFPTVSTPAVQPADAVVERSIVTYHLTNEHSWVETRSSRKKILSYAGKKRNGELKIRYNTGWSDVRVESAVVTAPDGTRTLVSSNEINVMDAPWVGSAPRYPPAKTLVASFPALDVGSTIDYRYVRIHRDRPFFAAREAFHSFDPVLKKSLAIRTPGTVRLVFTPDATDSELGFRSVADGEGRHRTWTAENAPAVKQEDYLPPWWSFTPTASASSGDWLSYASRLWWLLSRSAAGQKEAAAAARSLTKDTRDPWEKLTRIRDFVAVRIRPAGPGLPHLPLSAITPADRTLADGYGNTTDRAILLSAMLRAAGFRPDFVLASHLPFLPEIVDRLRAVPDPTDFPNVLVRLDDRVLHLPPSRHVYLNDTDQYAAVGACRHAGNIGLLIPSGKMIKLTPFREDLLEIEYAMAVSRTGDTEMTLRRRIHGSAFGTEKRRFSEMTPEERRRYYQELVGEISQGATSKGELIADFSSYPGRVEFSVSVPRYAVRTGRFLSFPLPDSLDGVLNMRSDTRTNPLYVPRRNAWKLRMQTDLPPGFHVQFYPAPLDIRWPEGMKVRMWSQTTESTHGGARRLVTTARASLEPDIIDPSLYPELLRMDHELSHKRARYVLLEQLEAAEE